jgi:hypothetical protein
VIGAIAAGCSANEPLSLSNMTASTMKLPTKVPYQNASTPSSKRLLRITSIGAAPITAPNAMPAPPLRLAPPPTAARNDSEFPALAQIGDSGAEPAVERAEADAQLSPEEHVSGGGEIVVHRKILIDDLDLAGAHRSACGRWSSGPRLRLSRVSAGNCQR